MKQLIVFLIFAYIGIQSYSQNTSLNLEKEKIGFTNKNDDYKLNSKLKVNQALIEYRCYPKLNTYVIDSLNSLTDIVIDANNVDSYLISDSTWIHLKDSYSWNIQNGLPKVRNKSVIKLLSKKEDKWTTEERKLKRYLAFYHSGNPHYVDNYVYYQNFKIESKVYQFVYYCVLAGNNFDFKLMRINEY